MDPIYALYKEYKDKPLDDYFIESAFQRMMEKETELVPYINGFKIESLTKSTLGGYNPVTKIVTIDKSNIEESTTKREQVIQTLEVLKHEIEHARNMKKYAEGKEDIESTVIRYALKDYEIMQRIQSKNRIDTLEFLSLCHHIKENYNRNPSERLARIKAWKYVVNLLKNQRRTPDLLVARTNLFYAYARGYEDNRYYLDAPTIQFLLNTRQFEDLYRLRKRIDSKDYSFETRITYGLPITSQEYDKTILQKVKLQKKKRGDEGNEKRI